MLENQREVGERTLTPHTESWWPSLLTSLAPFHHLWIISNIWSISQVFSRFNSPTPDFLLTGINIWSVSPLWGSWSKNARTHPSQLTQFYWLWPALWGGAWKAKRQKRPHFPLIRQDCPNRKPSQWAVSSCPNMLDTALWCRMDHHTWERSRDQQEQNETLHLYNAGPAKHQGRGRGIHAREGWVD